ncbi:N5-glutamine methyltransferase family protein [Gordonia shandongensis]|uniref:N5-glutamine methyltransferase family protein n=1 Tax=Gordonia shandongensis TaxID=376351 RepID=UPI00041DFA04|nr:methyltransferase [Gordonia shandongensis]
MTSAADARLLGRLRRAGCVFAEDELAELRRWASDAAELTAWVDRRVRGEPVEHLVGHVRFGDLDLAVGAQTFVPRQRSLLLAKTVSRLIGHRRRPVVVEPFCGVGPIAAHVAATHRESTVFATDVDPEAVRLASRNVGIGRVRCGPGLSCLPAELRGRIDVIAAVPPYVPESAADLLPHEARDHEPAAALFGGGADGLDHVRSLLAEAPDWLTDGGTVAVELNIGQLAAARTAARAEGLSPVCVVDEVSVVDEVGDVVTDGDGQTALLVAELSQRTPV